MSCEKGTSDQHKIEPETEKYSVQQLAQLEGIDPDSFDIDLDEDLIHQLDNEAQARGYTPAQRVLYTLDTLLGDGGAHVTPTRSRGMEECIAAVRNDAPVLSSLGEVFRQTGGNESDPNSGSTKN